MVAREAEWPRSEQALFWQFVRGRIAERRMTQSELARCLHLDRSVLTRRLNGQIRERPPATMVDQLITALQLSATESDQLRALAGYGAATSSLPAQVLTSLAANPPLSSPPSCGEASPAARREGLPAAELARPAARPVRQPLPRGVIVSLRLIVLALGAASIGFAAALYLTASGYLVKPASINAVVLRDDFSDPTSGWPTGREPAYGWDRAYADGEYIVASRPGLRGIARANRTDLLLRNVVVEVNARLPDPSPKTGVFVGTRLDATGYLRFEVWPEYQFCVFTRMSGSRDDMVATRLVYRSDFQTIRPGGAVNRVGIRAQGVTFIGLVNGEEALRLDDTTFLEGGIVLGAVSTSPDAAVEARFDDLVVTAISTVR